MAHEIQAQYDPSAVEGDIYRRWLDSSAFRAIQDSREARYVIMMPLPNVTGALHMGHAMDSVMQDLLIRWHRMQGDNSLWQPGTDHAGIATQAVVEKRLMELEGKTRHDVGREGLIQRIFDWKDQYQQRIIRQQQAMGCSCDWNRQRFTMDKVCTAAVREAFFRLFRDGLIYRGNRLVNWDCHLQTAVSDDEVVRENRRGQFWHLKYPVIDPRPGEPEYVVVATTRPETMLGDTAVAVHPEPGRQLREVVLRLEERLDHAPARERAALEQELWRVRDLETSHLPELEQLVRMAGEGRKIRLPLLSREIPLLLDEWAKPELGSGCVKITPAHDPNDYDVWTRHRDEIGAINLLNPDGTLNRNAGPYQDMDRLEARKRVVADLEREGLVLQVEEREHELGISDRSKTVIEPYLSEQWFVRMDDVDGGVLFGRGTGREFRSPGLAQAAIDAVLGDWRSPSGRKLTFHPDAERYGSTYVNWLKEKRDWCIGRQLWWGHRIPIWSRSLDQAELESVAGHLPESGEELWCRVRDAEGRTLEVHEALEAAQAAAPGERFELLVCPRNEAAEERHAEALRKAGLSQETDVLDTWFSSALWPFSTLGWPDPENASIDAGQQALGKIAGKDSFEYYYPGSCLVTGRDIITLWVARMVIFGLYCEGDMPFTDSFIHANILDGKGERMSKSKGNGIDPVDIIKRYGTDAMRYVLCDMQTGTQDIRLPVQAISPFTGKTIELAKAKHGRTIFTYLCPESGKEFDVLGTMADLPQAELISDRFEVGRNFCNKLWNAARYALMNLGDQPFRPLAKQDLAAEDCWILSRLARVTAAVQRRLEEYNPSGAVSEAREFFWNEFCDWYLELIKPRMKDADQKQVTGQVLAFVVDQTLRLFHPFVPFITEALWEKLAQFAPRRGIDEAPELPELLAVAPWPRPREADLDPGLESEFDLLRGVLRIIRDLRARYGVSPQEPLEAVVKAEGESLEILRRLTHHLTGLGRLKSLELAADPERRKFAATGVVSDVEISVLGLIDQEKERARLDKQRANLEKQMKGIESKLGNDKFLEKAPADVVENEKRRLSEFAAERARIEEALAQLER
ncbi:MAG: valine--tRNA ligase [Planctomycetota bacterium]